MQCKPADDKLRIAIVYSRSPLPMRRADQMTVANLMSFLHERGHAVDLFALRAGGKVSPEHEEWLASRCRKLHLIPHGPLQMLSGLLEGLVRGLPLQVGLFLNARQKRALRDEVRSGAYDIVYVYYLRSAEAAKDIRQIGDGSGHEAPTTYLALQLSQALNTRRIRDNAPNIWNRILYSVESKLIARYESSIWKRYSKSVLIGPRDLEAINSECAKLGREGISNHIYGAHGTDIERFAPRPDVPVRANRVLFSGVMRTPTNVQAAQWFVHQVWPHIRAAIPDATFEIVGREPTAEVQLLDRVDGVIVTGTVPDPAEHIAAAQVCVNPMQAGGGMQNKLIEFLAAEKPVVATSVANEGVMAPDDALRIADDPQAFAQAVVDLLNDPEGARLMASRARSFVTRNWTWEAHFLKLEADFVSAKAASAVRRKAA